MWYLGVGVVSKENNNLECVDCSPSRKFRNLAGLKGHMQFKHDKTGSFIERPPSKTNAMIQQLLDQQGQLLNQQQALYELLAAGFDSPIAVNEPIGVFSGGNGNDNPGNDNPGNNHQGNGNPGNNHQGNGNADQGEDVQPYHCEDCESPIFPGQEHCPTCKKGLRWNRVAAN